MTNVDDDDRRWTCDGCAVKFGAQRHARTTFGWRSVRTTKGWKPALAALCDFCFAQHERWTKPEVTT